MAVFNKFNAFADAVMEKVHDFGADTLKVALSNTAPTASNAVLADITEISYTYCSPRALTVASSSQSGGLYKLVVNNLTLTAGGGSVGPFRYLVIYNDSAASKQLVGWYDYGSALTLADTESLTLAFDATNGMLQLQ